MTETNEGFTSQGFEPFPNTMADQERLHSITEWSDELLEDKVYEYWQFLERKDLMPRAIAAANRMLLHMGYEVDCRFLEKEMGE